MSMIDKTFVVLEKYIDLLTEYQAMVAESLRRSNQQNDPEAFMLQEGFSFGIRTIRAMLLLLKENEDNAIFANILCRTFYEVSLRLLWAARTPDGWQRLCMDWANKDRIWAKEAQNMPFVAEHATGVFQSRTEIRNHIDANGNKYLPFPKIPVMLKEIENRDKADDLREENANDAAFEYTNVYRLLCRSVHGHIRDISSRKLIAFLPFTCKGTMTATFALLQTYCHVGATNPKDEIKTIIEQIIAIAKDVHE